MVPVTCDLLFEVGLPVLRNDSGVLTSTARYCLIRPGETVQGLVEDSANNKTRNCFLIKALHKAPKPEPKTITAISD